MNLSENITDDCLAQVTQMSNLDRLLFLVGGSFSTLFLLLLIIVSRRFKSYNRRRRQLDDLVVALSVSYLLLIINWIVLAVSPTKINNDDESFCKTIGAVSVFASLLNFLYNISFSIYLITSLRNVLTQDKIPQTRLHVMSLTISLVLLYLARNLIGKTLAGTCSIKSPCSENLTDYFVPGFAFAYCILGILTSFYFKRNFPICSRIAPQWTQSLNHYLKYNQTCTFIYFLIAISSTLENLVVIPQIIKSGSSDSQWISSLSHLAQICAPLMLAIIRFNDPHTKQKLLHTLCAWWKRRRAAEDIEAALNDTRVLEADDVSCVHSIFEDARRQSIYTILACLSYHDQHRKTEGGLSVTRTSNKSPSDPFKQQEVFLIEDENIKTHLPHVKEELEQRRFPILPGTLKVYSSKIFGQSQDKEFFNISDSFDFRSSPEFYESMKTKRDLFLLSKDKKLILKAVMDTEIITLTSLLERSQLHFNKNPNSLISKIYGAYTYISPELDLRFNFILIKNVCGLPSAFIERAYEIQGSKSRHERDIGKDVPINFNSVGILCDADFRKYEKKLYLHDELRKTFIDQIKRDSEFLKNANLFNYSLMVFVVNKEEAKKEIDLSRDVNPLGSLENLNEPDLSYHMGIVDYFQPYSFEKKLEKLFNKIQKRRIWQPMDPDNYSYQFIQFICQIVEHSNNNFTYSKKIATI